jgi:NAD(P)-dependent dehydrogenase (short-subunit alcohol dehydrogenase family)
MQPRSILITGASSGLGAALAAAYAAPGVTLHLGGRDRGRLGLIVDRCRLLGARASGAAIDVTDAQAMTGWINAADALAPLELVIANAGVSASGMRALASGDGPAVTRQVFRINLDGVLNTVLPALERIRARPVPGKRLRGQIALVGSLAGLRGMPGSPAYSASKAAVRAWGQAMAIRLKSERIGVAVVLPGFVDTPMTRRNPFPMPMLMTPDRAARIIRRRLARGTTRIAFPWPLVFGAWLISVLPGFLADRILARSPVKSDV